MRPRLLDLYCCAGGAGMGYARAGFEVVGVDIKRQPNYPFTFVQADALEYLADHGHEFHARHASPPCQRYSEMSNCRPGLAEEYPDLVDATRVLLEKIGGPWVMENVMGSGLIVAPDLFGGTGVLLCGRMFGLSLYRHRAFETSLPIAVPPHPRHDVPASKAGHWKPGTIISVAGNCSPIAVAREAMGIDWMNRNELAEAIPPAYTEWIGAQLIDQLTLTHGGHT